MVEWKKNKSGLRRCTNRGNYWIILFLIFSCIECQAQQIYFNKRLDFGCSENGAKILQLASGEYNILSGGVYCLGPGIKDVIARLDSNGNLMFSKVIGKDSVNIYCAFSGMEFLEDSSIAYASSISDSSGNTDILIIKLTREGDSISVQQYGDSLFQSGWMLKHTRDKGFAISGQTSTYDFWGDVLLLKTDSAGFMQWEKHFGDTEYDIGTCIDTCFDGGFILGGGTLSYGIGAGTSFGNAYVIKTDDLGNQQWMKTFGNIYDDAVWKCLQTKDSNFVFAGYFTFWDPFFPSNCCRSYSKPYIFKLDLSGNTIWEKTYGPERLGNTLYSIKELDDGSFVAVGTVLDSAVAKYRGLIMKINSSGDSLWYYTYKGLSGNSSCFLREILPTNDGGFIAIGEVVPSLPDTGDQDTWVLKVDSLGCEVFNCLFTSDGEVPEGISDEVNVFPNPTTGRITINTDQQIETFEVFDYMGTLQLYETNNHTIDLSGFSRGVYLYRIQLSGKKMVTGKLVKQE